MLSGIQYGSYNVWVINPGGQAAARLGELRLGQVLYLPATIHR